MDQIQAYIAQGDYVSALIALVAYLLVQVVHKGAKKAKVKKASKPKGAHASVADDGVRDGEVDPTDGE